jgi:hypothetical protein
LYSLVVCEFCPRRNDTRLGQQRGSAAYMLVKVIPWSTSRLWTFGRRSINSNDRSSATMTTTFGLSCAAVAGREGSVLIPSRSVKTTARLTRLVVLAKPTPPPARNARVLSRGEIADQGAGLRPNLCCPSSIPNGAAVSIIRPFTPAGDDATVPPASIRAARDRRP